MKHPETFEQEMKINDNEGPSSFFKLKKSALCKHFQNSVNWAIWLGLSFDHAPYDPKTQKKKNSFAVADRSPQRSWGHSVIPYLYLVRRDTRTIHKPFGRLKLRSSLNLAKWAIKLPQTLEGPRASKLPFFGWWFGPK